MHAYTKLNSLSLPGDHTLHNWLLANIQCHVTINTLNHRVGGLYKWGWPSVTGHNLPLAKLCIVVHLTYAPVGIHVGWDEGSVVF